MKERSNMKGDRNPPEDCSRKNMYELIQDEQMFISKITKLNQNVIQLFKSQQYQKCLQNVQHAQKILQYAASCGKTIDRFIIITTLHNQAAVYQRLLQLNQSYDYMEAVLFNMDVYFQQQPPNTTKTTNNNNNNNNIHANTINLNTINLNTVNLNTVNLNTLNVNVNEGMGMVDNHNYKIISSNLYRKICMVVYYLQFAAISSQLDKHQQAIKLAKKGLGLLNQVLTVLSGGVQNYVNQVDKWKSIINQFVKYSSGINKKQVCQIHAKIREQLKKTRQINTPSPSLLEHFRKFTISSVMQIKPISVQQSNQYNSIQSLLSPPQLTRIFLYTSICYYTIATELRLIAKKQIHNIQQNAQFKTSKIFHMFSIKIALDGIGFITDYLEHIIRSFKNNYHIDFNVDLLEYVQDQNIEEGVLNGDSFLRESQRKGEYIDGDVDKIENQKGYMQARPRRISTDQNYTSRRDKIPFGVYIKKKKQKPSNKNLEVMINSHDAQIKEKIHKPLKRLKIQNLSQQKMIAFEHQTNPHKIKLQSRKMSIERVRELKSVQKKQQVKKQLVKEKQKQVKRKKILNQYMTVQKKGEKSKTKDGFSKSKSSKSSRERFSSSKSSSAYGLKSIKK